MKYELKKYGQIAQWVDLQKLWKLRFPALLYQTVVRPPEGLTGKLWDLMPPPPPGAFRGVPENSGEFRGAPGTPRRQEKLTTAKTASRWRHALSHLRGRIG